MAAVDSSLHHLLQDVEVAQELVEGLEVRVRHLLVHRPASHLDIGKKRS